MNSNESYKSEYKATYYDGNTPVRHSVVGVITRDGLKIVKEDGDFIWWQFDEIKQTNDLYSEDEVRLERGEETPEILLIKDVSFIQSLKGISPESRKKFKPVVSNTKYLRYTLSIILGSVLTVVITYKWLLPAFTNIVVKAVPVSWEKKLGNNYKQYFIKEYSVCENDELKKHIDTIKDKLVGTIPNTKYEYNVTILDSSLVNAFALPGGEFVVFSGLIEKSTRPEELAGVMAHEIQHIEQRHSTKILVKDRMFDFVISSASGGSAGVETTLGIAKIVGTMAYRREEELSADIEGLKMLVNARIDPKGIIDFFKIMDKQYSEIPDIFKYISTHPDTGDRIQKLNGMISGYSFKPERLLPDVDWEKTRMLCKKTKDSADVTINNKHK